MAGGGGSPLELPDSPIPYSISLLFLIFLGIMLAWETLLGSLSFLAATKLTTVLRWGTQAASPAQHEPGRLLACVPKCKKHTNARALMLAVYPP